MKTHSVGGRQRVGFWSRWGWLGWMVAAFSGRGLLAADQIRTEGLLVRVVVTEPVAEKSLEKSVRGVHLSEVRRAGLAEEEEWRWLFDLESGSAKSWRSEPEARVSWFKVENKRAKSAMAAEPTFQSRQQGWDEAHDYLAKSRADVEAGTVLAVEPDIVVIGSDEVPRQPEQALVVGKASSALAVVGGPNPAWPQYAAMTSYLAADHSQLRAAAAAGAASTRRVQVAVLDIGFLANHLAFQGVAAEQAIEIADPRRPATSGRLGEPWFPPSSIVGNGPAHGTATTSLLAGRPQKLHGAAGEEIFQGGNPRSMVVPMRVGGSVIALGFKPFTRVSDIAAGFSLAADKRVDVLSMCVGGWPSGALADAVEKAQGAGVAMFCATGDFIGSADGSGLTSPKYVAFPAAYRPVMAVAGVTASGDSYGEAPRPAPTSGTLVYGSRGPVAKMTNAIAAWTPNIPWVRLPDGVGANANSPWDSAGAWNLMDLDGGGTSAACPQVAAAASLLVEKYHRELNDPTRYPTAWQRVEAIYWLLRTTARTPQGGKNEFHFGAGLLQAEAALSHRLPSLSELPAKKPQAESSWFYVLRLLLSSFTWDRSERDLKALDAGAVRQEAGRALFVFEKGVLPTNGAEARFHEAEAAMIEMELTQVIEGSEALQTAFSQAAEKGVNRGQARDLATGLLAEGGFSRRATGLLRAVAERSGN